VQEQCPSIDHLLFHRKVARELLSFWGGVGSTLSGGGVIG